MSDLRCFILFDSITYANKAKYFLGAAGIPARMDRIPESMGRNTCGYRISVRSENLQKAEQICREKNIRYRKIIRNGEPT